MAGGLLPSCCSHFLFSGYAPQQLCTKKERKENGHCVWGLHMVALEGLGQLREWGEWGEKHPLSPFPLERLLPLLLGLAAISFSEKAREEHRITALAVGWRKISEMKILFISLGTPLWAAGQWSTWQFWFLFLQFAHAAECTVIAWKQQQKGVHWLL